MTQFQTSPTSSFRWRCAATTGSRSTRTAARPASWPPTSRPPPPPEPGSARAWGAAAGENPAAEPGKPESLDHWEREDLDHWTDAEERAEERAEEPGEEPAEEQGPLAEEDPEHVDDVEATRAMRPVVPDEERKPPRSPGGQTEETRKLD